MSAHVLLCRCYEADEGPPQSSLTLLRPQLGTKEIDEWIKNRLDSFRKYSPLRVGAKQEVLAVGDPVSGSGAAEPLSNHRRGHRRADGEAHRGPRPLGEDERCAADDHALLRSRL